MKLKVLGSEINVKLCSGKEMDDGKYSGRAILMQHEIKLLRDMDKQNYKLNLLHELFHFAVDKLVINLDEEAIIRLSNFLLALINDNPDTFRFTLKMEE